MQRGRQRAGLVPRPLAATPRESMASRIGATTLVSRARRTLQKIRRTAVARYKAPLSVPRTSFQTLVVHHSGSFGAVPQAESSGLPQELAGGCRGYRLKGSGRDGVAYLLKCDHLRIQLLKRSGPFPGTSRPVICACTEISYALHCGLPFQAEHLQDCVNTLDIDLDEKTMDFLRA